MLLGNENTRVAHFGKRRRIAVTFKRVGGLWRAALLAKPQRNLRVARDMVRKALAQWHKEHGGE
jgi:hypothetical protein